MYIARMLMIEQKEQSTSSGFVDKRELIRKQVRNQQTILEPGDFKRYVVRTNSD